MGAFPPCIQLIAQQSTSGVQTAVGTRYMMIPTTKTFYIMDIVDIIAMMHKTQSITVCFLLFFHILNSDRILNSALTKSSENC